MTEPLQIVWFKRDLRIADHAPLRHAAEAGPVVPLYIVEPELWQQPDMAGRHWGFIRESLRSLNDDLTQLGQPLIVRIGGAVEVLSALAAAHSIDALWSHEETGNGWTFERDKRVRHWARIQSIPWHELPQNGVIRGLKRRSGWAKQWDQRMRQPVASPPPALKPVTGFETARLPSADDLGLNTDGASERQKGGRQQALDLLASFLTARGEGYQKEMSSPVTAFDACSRLSAHFAYGTLSIREAAQAAWMRQDELRDLPPKQRGKWPGAMNSFVGRLHWHCHFMQKLETEPQIEFRNMHRAYDGLREDAFDRGLFEAYCRAETGFPFVDACLRALAATGWINFRMRAMLMAFSSYHLWLHWREPSLFLARRFTDYEPGIHYSQSQMQSGTTGINTPRIYNPVKQSEDQDPDGVFIRAWVPELARLPNTFLHKPWRADPLSLQEAGVTLGSTYPDRIVDHEAAARKARDATWGVRRGRAYRETAGAIQDTHGSRRSGIANRGQPSRKRRSTPPAKADQSQQLLDLGDGEAP